MIYINKMGTGLVLGWYWVGTGEVPRRYRGGIGGKVYELLLF